MKINTIEYISHWTIEYCETSSNVWYFIAKDKDSRIIEHQEDGFSSQEVALKVIDKNLTLVQSLEDENHAKHRDPMRETLTLVNVTTLIEIKLINQKLL